MRTSPDDLCKCGHEARKHLFGYCTFRDAIEQCMCNGFLDPEPAVHVDQIVMW